MTQMTRILRGSRDSEIPPTAERNVHPTEDGRSSPVADCADYTDFGFSVRSAFILLQSDNWDFTYILVHFRKEVNRFFVGIGCSLSESAFSLQQSVVSNLKSRINLTDAIILKIL